MIVEKVMDYRDTYKQRHKASGLCISCALHATHGVYCRKHWEISKARGRRSRSNITKKYRSEGKCLSCGRVLDPESSSKVSCIVCNERKRKDQGIFNSGRIRYR